MKTIKFLFACLFATIFANAQENVPPHMMSDVEVTPPKFTAVKYSPTNNENSLKTFIAENFKYDSEFSRVTEGTEVVRFIINTDGSLSNIEVVNSVSPEVDNLITGIIDKTDYMWMPGKNNGVPVAMEKEVAIEVKLGMSESSATKRDFNEIARTYFTKGADKLFNDGKTKKAIRQFESAVRYKPYDEATLYMLAICELDQGNSQAAQAYVERFKKQGGNVDFLEDNLAEKVKSMDAYEEFTQIFATK
ncbi:energy transducer TonB [Draconibacterium halophilum]|uniref:TonB C-terminal domain-containing protein n=1 Tax=Draconibacterium halophilum TaxID=2706887 RepID=A0A6C0RBB8_9BACT|nr:energy transducer TonB [Draconibacterium halophilum]QIA07620.1 hypothetical protein G0Q07_07725 [Draconibacterium halophilum]